MSEQKPFWMQNLIQPETLLAQWQDGQQQTLEYLSQLIGLGAQSYQDMWRLSTEWMRELAAPPKAGNGALSTENAIEYAKRAQEMAVDQFEELERLNSDWWTNISKTTLQTLSVNGATARTKSDKRKTASAA